MGNEQKEIKIISKISESKPFLVIYKPKGIASAPLTSEDNTSALSQAINLFPELKKVSGKKSIEYGLLHRLDTETDGLIVIAATQDCYDFLIEEQKNGRFIKFYKAICDYNPENSTILEGFPINSFNQDFDKELIISSYFRNYGPGLKQVRPVLESSGKAALKKIGKPVLYTTKIVLHKSNESIVADCSIKAGYRHQVRCHLAWLGYPVQGDTLYNSRALDNTFELKFSAYKVEFLNPITKLLEIYTI